MKNGGCMLYYYLYYCDLKGKVRLWTSTFGTDGQLDFFIRSFAPMSRIPALDIDEMHSQTNNDGVIIRETCLKFKLHVTDLNAWIFFSNVLNTTCPPCASASAEPFRKANILIIDVNAATRTGCAAPRRDASGMTRRSCVSGGASQRQ
ncbi:MAG: hypothetical protein ACLVJH_16150 [Faecalibacterium prausnitzii]